jgi:hypothetical protein
MVGAAPGSGGGVRARSTHVPDNYSDDESAEDPQQAFTLAVVVAYTAEPQRAVEAAATTPPEWRATPNGHDVPEGAGHYRLIIGGFPVRVTATWSRREQRTAAGLAPAGLRLDDRRASVAARHPAVDTRSRDRTHQHRQRVAHRTGRVPPDGALHGPRSQWTADRPARRPPRGRAVRRGQPGTGRSGPGAHPSRYSPRYSSRRGSPGHPSSVIGGSSFSAAQEAPR